MLLLSIILLTLGVFLSAFFSGCETGFYRASRVRMVIEAIDGDRVSRWMLKLFNNPTLFVATTLIGNNVANYVTSLAIVLLTRNVVAAGSTGSAAEMIAPIVMAPLLFVYGELMPKNLFYQAPNRLLRIAGPLFLFFTCVFAPVAAVLWGLGRVLERVLGQSPERVRLEIARKEVEEVLEEGQEVGILHRSQRLISQNFFAVASKPVGEVATPIARVVAISADTSIDKARKTAERKKMPDLPVWQGRRGSYIGYVRTIDMLIAGANDSLPNLRPLIKIAATELYGEALMRMQAERETLALVVDSKGQASGILSIDQLTNPLLDGPLDSLRR